MNAASLRTSIPVVLLAILASLLAGPTAQAATFNIEIDWMEAADHTHKPTSAEIGAVVQMFACHGHTLNVQLSNALPEYTVIARDPSNCSGSIFSYSGQANSYGKLKQDNFDHAGQSGWHYCIFAHSYEDTNCNQSGSSGIATLGGVDIIVSLGTFSNQTGTPFDKAATLAHEFGHNLGLSHCAAGISGGNCDDPTSANWIGQFQPNLASVMSYFYQLTGVRTNLLCQGLLPSDVALFKEIDYSNGTMCTLNEWALDEVFGSGMQGVDFNCDGSIQGIVAHDLNGKTNGWCNANTGLQVLPDLDEWASIHDSAGAQSAMAPQPVREISCITSEEASFVQQKLMSNAAANATCAQPTLTTESCITGLMVYLNPAGGVPVGTCSLPVSSVQLAHDISPSGSQFFLAPGTYNETGTVLLNKHLTLRCTPTVSGKSAIIK